MFNKSIHFYNVMYMTDNKEKHRSVQVSAAKAPIYSGWW